MVAQTSLADYAAKCCVDLKNDCVKIESERCKELKNKPLAQRVAFVACKGLQYGGMGVALASFAIGTFFSWSFALVGAAGLVAFAVGVIARSRFETISPLEEQLIARFKNLDIATKCLNLPSADQLKAMRSDFINDVAKLDKAEIDNVTKSQAMRAYAFTDFFGGKGLSDKLKKKQPLSAKELAAKEQAKARVQQVKVVYVTTQLLEGIQNIAKGNFAAAKENAKFIQARKDVEIPQELQQKVDLLAARMKEPSKELQEKVKKAVGQKFKLRDLDSVYTAVAG